MMTKIREKSEEEVSAWKMDKEATKPRNDGWFAKWKKAGKAEPPGKPGHCQHLRDSPGRLLRWP
jgi:hypothetical protein